MSSARIAAVGFVRDILLVPDVSCSAQALPIPQGCKVLPQAVERSVSSESTRLHHERFCNNLWPSESNQEAPLAILKYVEFNGRGIIFGRFALSTNDQHSVHIGIEFRCT